MKSVLELEEAKVRREIMRSLLELEQAKVYREILKDRVKEVEMQLLRNPVLQFRASEPLSQPHIHSLNDLLVSLKLSLSKVEARLMEGCP